jgi:flagellar basal-body rod modification protein FlgD
MQVAVDGAITSGTVTIKDAAGNTVKTINLPPGNGPFQLGWDGTNNAGVQVPSGSYSISVTTTGAGGNSVTGTPEITGTISAVDLGAQGTLLQIGNASVTPADVLSIGATGGTP